VRATHTDRHIRIIHPAIPRWGRSPRAREHPRRVAVIGLVAAAERSRSSFGAFIKMRRNAAVVEKKIPAMMKKTQLRERQLDRSVTTRDAESEIAADLAVGHRHLVTPCSPLAPTQAPCYAMKGVMHPQVEVFVDNKFEAVHQVICPLYETPKQGYTQPFPSPPPPPPPSPSLSFCLPCLHPAAHCLRLYYFFDSCTFALPL
jgi:hypothetical protein